MTGSTSPTAAVVPSGASDGQPSTATAGGDRVLHMAGVTKTFPGVVALEDVSFEVVPGEVHALVGENGAGKSTLMAVASGALRPDGGSVEIGGVELTSSSPRQAERLGLAIVRQHPALLPDLSVAENLLLAVPPENRPTPSRTQEWARTRLEVAGAGSLDARDRVDTLSVHERQLLEIAKALSIEPRVLILDEPTEALSAEEIDRLFAQVRAITATGTAVVYISHRIPEILQIADRLTILRGGRVRGTRSVAGITEKEIVDAIVGREVGTAFPDKATVAADATAVLRVEGLTGTGFRDVSFVARPGEIIGLAGVKGNGQEEVLRGLAGLVRSSGVVALRDSDVPLATTDSARRAGVAYVSPDRHHEGLFMPLSVRENIGLGGLAGFVRGGLLRPALERRAVTERAQALNVKAPSLGVGVDTLSGGNQQKVLLSRALLGEPKLLLVDEPTQGVDVGARLEIYRILREAAASGVAVVVLSSDGIELAGLCDRVLVFSRGRIADELADGFGEHDITTAALTGVAADRGTAGPLTTRRRLPRFLSGDLAPSAVLVALIVLLGGYTAFQSSLYLTGTNIQGYLTLLTALGFIALGQQVLVMTGGIDLSVGPLAGFAVVVASFFVLDDVSVGSVVLGFVLMAVVAIAVGLLNSVLAQQLRLGAVVATLVTYIGLQGASLLLRDTPGGSISIPVVDSITTSVGVVPVAFLVVVVAAVGLEWALRRTRWGLNLRATGSAPAAASALGIDVGRTRTAAYVACSLLTAMGAVMLMAQIGVGDPTAGTTYILSSITAVVLGGASIFGGRGSFVGVLLGAALIQQITNVTTFLELSQSWQYWLLGALTIAAAGMYSGIRRLRAGPA